MGEGGVVPPMPFVTRYFEIAPGGFSSLERHRHAHAVVVIRGRGKVILGSGVHELQPFDCVEIGPDELHQLRAAADAPLGFLCTVARERDRPVAATAEEIDALCRDPRVRAELRPGEPTA